jgi:hypothetical protein
MIADILFGGVGWRRNLLPGLPIFAIGGGLLQQLERDEVFQIHYLLTQLETNTEQF